MSAPDLESALLAAVDLGSNSFHLLIARVVDGGVQVVDRVREPVCLAAGLDGRRRLSKDAQDRALACLERMAQRLRGLPPELVRVVGTNTLRRAANAAEFRQRAEATLGHAVEIIPGSEEARLIYLGVATSEFSPASRLVIDIGGGSTEIILGEGFEVLRAHSLFMGCVDWTRRYFPDGELKKEHFRRAEIAARLELSTMEQELRSMGWESAVGASGTIQAVHEIVRANGWSDGEIEPEGVKRLRRAMIDAGHVDRLSLPGLRADRVPVLAGGLAILRAAFKSFELAGLGVSAGSLREGALYDLLGRIRHEDVRDRTIAALVERYHVDLDQASRVARTALRLAQQVDVGPGIDAADVRRLLTWGARLHEIGLAVAHTGFHRHGAYLVAHGDMPGFSADDQRVLAALIRGHRRKIARAQFGDLPAGRVEPVIRLCVLLRLAALLNRGRTTQAVPALDVAEDWTRIALAFPPGWPTKHPLTLADLEQERERLGGAGIELAVRERKPRAKRR